MTTGGLQRVSLIDYPEKISAIVFMQGCNFRCPYCHNRELVHPHLFKEPIPQNEILSLLEHRKGLLEGVVVTGGEPLLQSDLADFLREVRAMGYRIKLDTNGSEPDRLERLLKEGLVDYIAMDYKAPLRAYSKVAGVEIDTGRIKRSMGMITGSGLPYEMRTTVYNGLGMSDILDMMMELRSMNVESYFLQVFKPFSGCSEDLSPVYLDIEYLYENLMYRFWKYGIRNIKKEAYEYAGHR
ncbi:MAG TPA: anaerobic ribonucleoside-triphosphate reductase activating protein [Nitrospirae bacterium]|nr:anaerobic ribonucleoside-triphosphate reductase activating protein [Nitrospirota bacterium]HDZ88970.1 anaerobic ribonucleoside-triphosphate reductase activating protein [Nitrospirota bacterium]